MPGNDNNANTNNVSSAIGMAAPLVGSIMTGINTAAQNKYQLAFAKEQFYNQRQWALEDWNMQNEYNLPKNVRARMIEGGLNPALMYGKGAGDLTTGSVRSTPNSSYNPKTVDYDRMGNSVLMSYLAIQKQTAELDQMNLQNDLIRERIKGQQATTQLTWDKSQFTQSQNDKLQMWINGVKDYNNIPVTENEVLSGQYTGTDIPRNYIAEQNWLNTKNAWQKYANAFNENERREIYTANNTDMVVARIAEIAMKNAKTEAEIGQIKANTDLLIKSGVLKQFNITGQELLNSQFQGVASRIILGLLNRADIIR